MLDSFFHGLDGFVISISAVWNVLSLPMSNFVSVAGYGINSYLLGAWFGIFGNVSILEAFISHFLLFLMISLTFRVIRLINVLA